MTEDEFNVFMVYQEIRNCFDEFKIDRDVPILIDDSNVVYKRNVLRMEEYTGWKLCAMYAKRRSIISTKELEYELLIDDYVRPRTKNCCDDKGYEYAWNEVYQDDESCQLLDVGVHKKYYNNIPLDSVKTILNKQRKYYAKYTYRDMNHISIGASDSKCVQKIIKELVVLGFNSYDVSTTKYYTDKELDKLMQDTKHNIEMRKKTAPNKR